MNNKNRYAEAMRIALAFRNEGSLTDISPGGWGKVKRQLLTDQLIKRLNWIAYPNQGSVGFCGGASFFYCLMKDRPDLYVQLIVDLWTSGKAQLGALALEPGIHLLRYTDIAVADDGIPAIDWISMASVRDYDGNYKVPSHRIGQATIATTLKRWFEAVGAKVLIDNTHILGRANWSEFLDISCYSTSAWIVMLINANLLADQETGSGSFIADHWVVVSEEIRVNNISAPRHRPAVNKRGCVNSRSIEPPDGTLPIDFTVFSWGRANRKLRDAPNTSISYFLDRYHGAVVFSQIP